MWCWELNGGRKLERTVRTAGLICLLVVGLAGCEAKVQQSEGSVKETRYPDGRIEREIGPGGKVTEIESKTNDPSPRVKVNVQTGDGGPSGGIEVRK